MIRFLKGLPRIAQKIPFSDHPPAIIRVFTDSDWAASRKTRKPTNGGVLYSGESAVRGWASTQAVIALSSVEAEYYVALKGACAALGFQSMPAALGMKAKVVLL